MGNNSGKSSVSFGKVFFRRADDVRQRTDVGSATSQERNPVFKVSGNGRKTAPSHTTSCGIRELNSEGFVIYNIPDKDDIYVAKSSPTADFGEEIEMKSVSSGDFIGNVPQTKVEINTEPESVTVGVEYIEPADIFVNAKRREKFEEIDFGETIIITKPNEDFDVEIESDDLCPQISTADAKADVFEGLYVEGNEPASAVASEESSDPSSFCRTGAEEVVMTSAAVAQPMSSGLTEFPQLAESAFSEITEATSEESIASPPSLSVITDPVADVMKLFVPTLRHDEMVLDEASSVSDVSIPDDGLEAYDAKFSFIVTDGKESGTV